MNTRSSIVTCLLTLGTFFWGIGCNSNGETNSPSIGAVSGRKVLASVPHATGTRIVWLDIDTGAATPLHESNLECSGSSLSPDGHLLAFCEFDKDKVQLRVVDLVSKETYQLPIGSGSPNSPVFTDNEHLIFVVAQRLRPYSMGGQIWDDMDVASYSFADKSVTLLTHSKYRVIRSLTYSPAAHKIAFSAQNCGSPTPVISMAKVVDDALSDIRELPIRFNENAKANEWIIDPAFSPDASTLAFVSNHLFTDGTYSYEVWTSKPDGSQPFLVTHNRGLNSHPAFSGDGKVIVYVSQPKFGENSEIWRVNVDGSSARKIEIMK